MNKASLIEHFTLMRHDFDNSEGIIEPIRCLVVKEESYYDTIRNVAEMLSDTFINDNYKEKSQIVGYFAAIKDKTNNQVYIGMSICDPADYYKKDKMIGQISAISSIHEKDPDKFIPIALLLENFDVDFELEKDPNTMEKLNNIWVSSKQIGHLRKMIRTSHTGNADNLYVFAYRTLGEQLIDFADRCLRYFFPVEKAVTKEN